MNREYVRDCDCEGGSRGGLHFPLLGKTQVGLLLLLLPAQLRFRLIRRLLLQGSNWDRSPGFPQALQSLGICWAHTELMMSGVSSYNPHYMSIFTIQIRTPLMTSDMEITVSHRGVTQSQSHGNQSHLQVILSSLRQWYWKVGPMGDS